MPPTPRGPDGVYRILSFDGAGVHGVLALRLLGRLLDRRPDLFSRVTILAGAGAGAITALALAAGDLDGPRATGRLEAVRRLWSDPSLFANTLSGALSATAGLTPLFSPDPLVAAVATLLPESLTLDQLARCVVVPTVHLDEAAAGPPPARAWRARVFRNFALQDGRPGDGVEAARDVALRGSALLFGLPSYQGYVDGSLYASNPALLAALLAIGAGAEVGQLQVLSLGTGRNSFYVADGSGPWGWAPWLLNQRHPIAALDLLADSVEDAAADQAALLLGERHFRFDPPLNRLSGNVATPTSVPRVDAQRADSIDVLRTVAETTSISPAVAWLDAHGWTAVPAHERRPGPA